MITNIISMNGSGFYVWLSFGITVVSCAVVYFKTQKTLRKYEKEFVVELNKLSSTEKKIVLAKSKIANQVFALHKKAI
jgi:heme exporter protein CcmD